MTERVSAAAEDDKSAQASRGKWPTVRRWLGSVGVLLGVLVVFAGFVAFTRLTAPPGTDVVAVRAEAGDGALNAIASLWAGGTLEGVKTAGSANQIGAPDAPVTIVEFSDFQ